MNKLSVNDLATILQLETSFKETLVKDFDNYDDNLKDKILEILWSGIHELEERLAQIKYQEYLINEDNKNIMTNLYDEAVKEVWNDFDNILSGKPQENEMIQSIRNELSSNIEKQIGDIDNKTATSNSPQLQNFNNSQNLMKKQN